MTGTDGFFDMAAAPLRIGAVRLRVRDAGRVAAFYQAVLGLRVIDRAGTQITLGAGDTALLHLDGDAALAPRDPRQAGLFHTAFLLPTRADLARWLAHALEAHVWMDGASDHLVSEAIYLSDPEGNGIEVYADRPVAAWHDAQGAIAMDTRPLNARALMAAGEGRAWAGFPAGGTIGHVHLQVGDTVQADAFYAGICGLDIAARYPGASFYGSGGYHHQLAGNVWNSAKAGPRPAGAAGLAAVELVARDADVRARIVARTGTTRLHDPWGTLIELRA